MRLTVLSFCVLLAACGGPPPGACATEPFLGPDWVLDAGVFCDVSGVCATPTLVRAPRSSAQRPLRMLFVSEGYVSAELPSFRSHVDELLNGAVADPDSIPGRLADRLEVWRLELESAGGFSTQAGPTNTALGGCLRVDALGGPQPLLATTRGRATTRLTPTPDVQVVLFNTDEGRANAPRGWVFQNRRDDWHTLNHELGHALVGLGDEYTDTPLRWPGDEVFRRVYPAEAAEDWDPYVDEADAVWPPNLTPDATGAKWQHLVASVFEGGRRYRHGLFHPTRRCRMQDAAEPFCPVCANAVERWISALGASTDGVPPRCSFESARSLAPFEGPEVFVDLRCRDADRLAQLRWKVDGKVEWNLEPFLRGLPDFDFQRVGGQLHFSTEPTPPNVSRVWLSDGPHTFEATAVDQTGAATTVRFDFVTP